MTITLNNQVSPIPNALAYGINPANPDNTPALQAFINNANNPSMLFFPKGTYNFLSPAGLTADGIITVSRNIQFIGEGDEVTNFHFTSTTATNKWAFDCTARTPYFQDLRIISTTGRSYNSGGVGFIDDGRNLGGIRLGRNSTAGGGLASVQGDWLNRVTIEGFSGWGVSVHQAIHGTLNIDYVRWCLGVLITNNKASSVVSTTVRVRGYLNGCPRGWYLQDAVDLDMSIAIAEECGTTDGTYGAFNPVNCRRIMFNQLYAESNKGNNLQSVDSRYTLITPDFYLPPTAGRTNVVASFSGMAWEQRGSTWLDALGLRFLLRNASAWASLGLHYLAGTTNTLLGLGYDNGNGMRTIRTHKETNQQIEATVTTTNATQTTLLAFALPDPATSPNRINGIMARVRINVWDITNEDATPTPELLMGTFFVDCGARRRAGETAQVGTAVITAGANNTAVTTGSIAVDTSAGQLRVRVTGVASRTYVWEALADTHTRMALIQGGTATGGTFDTLVDSSKAWTTNQWVRQNVRIVSGTGAGQTRVISGNTATTLTLRDVWQTAPDSTSVYQIGSF